MPNYTTFYVLFFVRKHHEETKKLFIYTRIAVDGKRSEISLKRSIPVNIGTPQKDGPGELLQNDNFKPVLRPGMP